MILSAKNQSLIAPSQSQSTARSGQCMLKTMLPEPGGAAGPGDTRRYAASKYSAALERALEWYGAADVEPLLAFRREALGPGAPQARLDYLRWQSEQNPNTAPGSSNVLMFRWRDQIRGQISTIPAMLRAGASIYRAHWGVDLIVHSSWRGFGAGTVLTTKVAENTDVALGLAISEDACQSLARAGWTDLGALPLYVRPLNFAAALANRLSARTGWLLGAIPDLGLRMFDGALGCAISALGDTHLIETSRFDERVDRVWRRVVHHYPVLCVRDQRTLNWRYAEHPVPGRYRIYWLARRGEVIGYAVLRVGTWRALRCGYVVDYFCAPGDVRTLFALCLGQLRRLGAALVYCLHVSPAADDALKSLGFVARNSGCRMMISVGEGARDGAALLADPSRWFITAGDGDVDRPATEEFAS